MTRALICPSCGAPLEAALEGQPNVRCAYCHSIIRLDDAPAPEAQDQRRQYAQILAQARALVMQGNKLAAIKLLRDELQIGLAQAKQAADRIELGEDPRLEDQPLRAAPVGQGNAADIVAAIQSGNKIQAIKIFRERFGVELKEAKDAVDAIELGLSELPAADDPFQPVSATTVRTAVSPPAAAHSGAGCLTRLLSVMILLGILAGALVPLLVSGGPLNGLWRTLTGGPRVELSFGAQGSGLGYLDDPRALAISPDGDYYVADFDSGRVQRFSAAGEALNQWLIAGDAIISALAVDSDSRVYVVTGGQVLLFNARGEAQGEFSLPEYTYAEDIAIGADGALVLAANGDTLLRYTPQGRLDWVQEDALSRAAGESELDTRLALDGLGNIYAAGSFTGSVFKFSSKGQYLTRWGSAGDADGQFRAMLAIGVDNLNQVYVSDIKGIQVFSADGRYLRLIRPADPVFAIAFDRQNRLTVTENTPQVVRYAPQAGE